MDILQESALSFQKLFEFDYHVKAGKKGKLFEVTLFFNSSNFHHLLGLHKLKDLPNISNHTNKSSLFKSIIDGSITHADIKTSLNYDEIDMRLNNFNRIENILKIDNEVVIKFDQHKAHTTIDANFLIYEHFNNDYLHLFFGPFNQEFPNKLVPRSFIIRNDTQYIDMQERYTLLEVKQIPKEIHVDNKLFLLSPAYSDDKT